MKRFKNLLAIVVLVLATTSLGLAQTFENTGTVNNSANGKIIMKNNSVKVDNKTGGTITNAGVLEFEGVAPVFNNDGTFTNTNGILEFSGAMDAAGAAGVFSATTATDAIAVDSDSRLDGYIIFSSTTTQSIIPGYYHNVYLTAGTAKTFDTGTEVFVSGIYDIDGEATINGITDYATTSGDRIYSTNSLFTYDGTDAQTIVPEDPSTTGGSNTGYYNLDLTLAGAKTLAGGALVQNIFNNAATAAVGLTITPAGNLKLGTLATTGTAVATFDGTTIVQGTDAATFGQISQNYGTAAINANLTVNQFAEYNQTATAGNLAMNSPAIVSVDGTISMLAPSTANATLADGAALAITANGALALGTGGIASNLFIQDADGFTNANTDGDNMSFDPISIVTYNGAAQNVLPTVAGFPYGNLALAGATIKVPAGATYTVNDINVVTTFSLDNANLNMGTGATDPALVILTAAADNVTYDPDLDADGLWEVVGNMRRTTGATDNVELTYNNSDMRLTLTNDADQVDDITLNNKPATAWSHIDAATDVNRSVAFTYNPIPANAAAATWVAQLQYSYNHGELPDPADAFQKQLRMREEIVATPFSEKISTGGVRTPSYSTATTFGSVTLAGIRPAEATTVLTELEKVASGSEIFLRGGPTTFISVNPGRWSNPATWDEYAEPTSNDIVEVRHTVHAGFVRANDNYTTEELYPSALAAKVTVLGKDEVVAGVTYQFPSLLFGVSDAPAGVLFANNWNFTNADVLPTATDEGTLTINAFGATTPTDINLTLTAEDATAKNYDTGLVLFPGATNILNVEGGLFNNSYIENAGTVTVGK